MHQLVSFNALLLPPRCKPKSLNESLVPEVRSLQTPKMPTPDFHALWDTDFYYLSCVVRFLYLVFLFLCFFVAVAVGWFVWFGFFNRVIHSPATLCIPATSTCQRCGCCSTPCLVPVQPFAFFLGGRSPRSSAGILLPLPSPRTRRCPRRSQGS